MNMLPKIYPFFPENLNTYILIYVRDKYKYNINFFSSSGAQFCAKGTRTENACIPMHAHLGFMHGNEDIENTEKL